MPTLKQITCTVKEKHTKTALREIQTKYEDGVVTCFLLVGSEATEICISMESSGYIAPGLAMFVYIDGRYQANRNKTKLRLPENGGTMDCAEVNFDIWQRESYNKEGKATARGLALHPMSDQTSDPPETRNGAAELVDKASTIEVVVLRCSEDSRSSLLTNMTYEPHPDVLMAFPRYGGWQYQQYEDRIDNPVVENESDDLYEFLLAQTREPVSANTGLPSTGIEEQFAGLGGQGVSWVRYAQNTTPAQYEAALAACSAGQIPNILESQRKVELYSSSLVSSGSPFANRSEQKYLQHMHTPDSNGHIRPTHASIKGNKREYTHTLRTPFYIDTEAEPYARFIFKYCDKSTIEACIGGPIDISEDAAKEEFAKMTKEQLVEYLMAQRKESAVLSQANPTQDLPSIGWTLEKDGYIHRTSDNKVYTYPCNGNASQVAKTESNRVATPKPNDDEWNQKTASPAQSPNEWGRKTSSPAEDTSGWAHKPSTPVKEDYMKNMANSPTKEEDEWNPKPSTPVYNNNTWDTQPSHAREKDEWNLQPPSPKQKDNEWNGAREANSKADDWRSTTRVAGHVPTVPSRGTQQFREIMTHTGKQLEHVKRLDTEYDRIMNEIRKTFHSAPDYQSYAYSCQIPVASEMLNRIQNNGKAQAHSSCRSVVTRVSKGVVVGKVGRCKRPDRQD